jgi:hypothetical protein
MTTPSTPDSHDASYQRRLERLVKRKDIRSADRANMQRMLQLMRHGKSLSYQERQNLWAYLDRYEPGARLAP